MPWHVKEIGAYANDSAEAIDNATMIWGILKNKGWTLNAVCGVLGNIGYESGYNPWRWQGDLVPSITQSPWTNKGYGFTQFTPGGKYINDDNAKAIPGYGPNFADSVGNVNDGYAQIVFLDTWADYYPTSRFPISYADYKVSATNPGELAVVWLYNYERPGDMPSEEPKRRQEGDYWFKTLSGVDPPGPDPEKKESKWIYYYLKRRLIW